MKQKLLIIFCAGFFLIQQSFAQNHTITGTVTAKDDGLPVPGVSVKIKGTNTGVQTAVNGTYTISVPVTGVLVFSYIGFSTQSVPVGPNTIINLVLEPSSKVLGEVVVTTALGIKHSEKDLGYATAEITAKQITATAATNVANGLTGKVAGLAVYELDNSVDPNISIVLRGNRSLEGNNNALIVLDGVPMPGALLSSINPNDIADISILKGAGAAAIYGSEASNGVVAISTKRGSTTGKPTIIYQNSVQVEKVAFYPKLQTTFGTYGGEGNYIDPVTGFTQYVPYENQQYGPAYNGQLVQLGAPLDSANGKVNMVPYKAYPVSPIQAFFQAGITEQNDISYSQGDAKNSIFISAQNAYRTTVVPNDKNIRNAFSIRGHHTDGIFSVDYSAEYSKTTISTYIANNNPLNSQYLIPLNTQLPGSYVTTAAANDLYSSILQLPAFYNIKQFQDPDSDIGNPSNYPDAYAINPYWIVDKTRRDEQRDVFLAQLKLAVDPTKWLTLSYHVSDNFGIDQERYTKAEVDFSPYSVSDPFGAGSNPAVFKTGVSPGAVYDVYQYGDGTNNNPGYSRLQGDAIVSLHPAWSKDFRTDLLLGNSVYQLYDKYQITGSNQLLVNSFYNINTIGGQPVAQEGNYLVTNISFFGDLSINYKGFLNLEGTYRNEQDSRLSKAERSFNYPSVKISFVPTEIIPNLKNSDILTYAKFYGSLSRVGNINIGPYEIYNTYNIATGYPYGSLGGLTASTTNYSSTLKPEITTETEVGTELAFFRNRLDVNFSYYNSLDRNQTVNVSTSTATGYTNSILNIGETQSQGYEFQVTGQILTQAANKISWTLGSNFSINNSKVIALLPGVNQLFLGGHDYAVVGQPFPMLKGVDFVRDPQGQVVVGSTGYPEVASALTNFGRTSPKYDLGVTSSWTYKFVSLSAVFEYRGGDVTYNALGSSLSFTGASEYSASNGRQRFIYPNSVIQTGANTYVPNTSISVQDGNYGFWQTSAFNSVNSPWVTSGAFWKLRELNLTFNLDKFIKQAKYMKGLSVALTGRNLFIWTPKENTYTDPEFSDTLPTSAARGSNDVNELPGTRIFGGSVKVTF